MVESVEAVGEPADEPTGASADGPTDDPTGGSADGPTGEASTEADADPAAEEADAPLAYEIVFDCKDKMLGARLANRLDEVLGPTYDVRRTEEVTGWAVVIEFPSSRSADRFFDSDFYRQFCIEARRSCRSAVLVVPLGPV